MDGPEPPARQWDFGKWVNKARFVLIAVVGAYASWLAKHLDPDLAQWHEFVVILGGGLLGHAIGRTIEHEFGRNPDFIDLISRGDEVSAIACTEWHGTVPANDASLRAALLSLHDKSNGLVEIWQDGARLMLSRGDNCWDLQFDDHSEQKSLFAVFPGNPNAGKSIERKRGIRHSLRKLPGQKVRDEQAIAVAFAFLEGRSCDAVDWVEVNWVD